MERQQVEAPSFGILESSLILVEGMNTYDGGWSSSTLLKCQYSHLVIRRRKIHTIAATTGGAAVFAFAAWQ